MDYSLEGHVLTKEDSTRYLSVELQSNMAWNKHMDQIIKKGNSMMGFLRRNLKDSNESIWATSRENVSSGVFDQVTFKPACPATEASLYLDTLDIASIHIILSRQRTTKVLIRLRGCAGWSTHLLFAYGLRHVFTWPGPYNKNCCISFLCHIFTGVQFHSLEPLHSREH